MRRIGIAFFGIMALAGLIMMLTTESPALYSADDYLFTTGAKHDSTFMFLTERPYRNVCFDTHTYHLRDGNQILNLGHYGYNFFIRSLNPAGNSTYVKVAFSSHQGIWHHDSVARNMDKASVGEKSADDYLIAPIEANMVYVYPAKGDSGTDSTCLLELKYFR